MINLHCPFCLLNQTTTVTRNERSVFDRITIQQAIDFLLKAKTAANLRPRYVNSLRQYLAQFSKGREASPLIDFRSDTIESWFASRTEAAVTRASNLGRLSSLFGYAFRRGWIPENPCKRMERVRIDHHAPVILPPDIAKKMLQATADNCKPYVVLGMFAGIRPEEISMLTWSDFNPELTKLTVSYSKTRRRRLVRLEPVVTAWLKTFTREGKVAPSIITIKRMRKKLRPTLEWHQDILRHTAASYLMALHRDVGRVSTTLGNSPAILAKHYLELVSEEDCKAFWELTPETVNV